jgi:membrane protease YdiL (CAAX protease family)
VRRLTTLFVHPVPAQNKMTDRRIVFDGGVRTLAGFTAAWVALFAVFIPLERVASGVSPEAWYLQEVAFFLAIVGVTVLLARLDGVRLGDLGLSRRHLLPALVAFAGVYLGLNVLGVGLAVGFGLSWGLGMITDIVSGRYASLPASLLLYVLLSLLVGVAEELSIRGYFQNKVIAALGTESSLWVGLGILTASMVFGLLHVPGALLMGTSATGLVGLVASRTATGLFFGTFYELTRNVYFVALLHTLGNTWPLVVEWGDWSGTALYAFFLGVTILYFGAAFGYRRWAEETDLAPTAERTNSGSRPSMT